MAESRVLAGMVSLMLKDEGIERRCRPSLLFSFKSRSRGKAAVAALTLSGGAESATKVVSIDGKTEVGVGVAENSSPWGGRTIGRWMAVAIVHTARTAKTAARTCMVAEGPADFALLAPLLS